MPRVRVFDDLYSLAHLALGLLAGLAGGLDALILTALYAWYQTLDDDSVAERLGDIIEYAAGYAAATAARILYTLLYRL